MSRCDSGMTVKVGLVIPSSKIGGCCCSWSSISITDGAVLQWGEDFKMWIGCPVLANWWMLLQSVFNFYRGWYRAVMGDNFDWIGGSEEMDGGGLHPSIHPFISPTPVFRPHKLVDTTIVNLNLYSRWCRTAMMVMTLVLIGLGEIGSDGN